MKEIKVKDSLLELYKDSYSDTSESRDINALGKVSNIINFSRDIKHEKILEIGCGEGAILKQLSDEKFGKELHGLEISSTGVEITSSRGIPNLVSCSLFDGYNTNFKDNEFDLVILSHVLEHVEFPRLLIYEAQRISKNIYIEVPLEHTIRLKKNFILTPVGHINYFTIKTIRILIQSCNLFIKKARVANQTLTAKKHNYGLKGVMIYLIKSFLLKISPSIATKLFVYHYTILCTK